MKKKILCSLLTFTAIILPIMHADEIPHYGTWGFDLSAQDTSVKPGSDFFYFANGHWLACMPIPPDRSSYGVSQIARDLVEKRLHQLLEKAKTSATHKPNDLAGKVGAFYRSFMDEKRVDSLGFSPIQPSLTQVQHAKSHDAVIALMGRNNFDFFGSIFALGIDVDAKTPTEYSLFLSPARLGLPSRDYYTKPEFADERAKYQAYIAKILHLISWDKADQQVKEILQFETAMSEVPLGINASYSAMTMAELRSWLPEFNWKQFFESAKVIHPDRIVVNEKTACEKIARIYKNTSLDTIKAWQAFMLVNNSAPYLSRKITDAYFELYGKVLSGQQEPSPRWQRAVLAVGGGDFSTGERIQCFGNMGWAVGQMYAKRYFSQATKDALVAITNNLKISFRNRLEKLSWMAPETKNEALKKLDRCTIEVGYPDKLRDYSGLRIVDDDLIGNVLRAAQADWHYQLKQLKQPVDKTEWKMTPQTINAYNSPFGQLIFPAAILLPPMYDPDADLAVNYGSVGAFIGHEITHGFDDVGRTFDADGAERNWWTKNDSKQFEERTAKLSAQYASFEVLPGLYLNAKRTLSENIADLGGLAIAFDAYHLALQGKTAPILNGYTGDQRFFLGWAQLWRGKFRDDALRRYVASDPHSPRKFRVNGPVRNIDAWYQAFDVQPGDALYLAPDKRVQLW